MTGTQVVGRNLIAWECVSWNTRISNPSRSVAYIAAYFGLWATVLLLLRSLYSFEAGEALAALVILGLIFPALALLATRHLPALPYMVKRPAAETAMLLAWLALFTLVVASGFAGVQRITTEPLHSLVLLAVKLATAVVFPAAILMALGRYSVRELIPFPFHRSALRPALWMSLAALVMQSFLGHGLNNIRNAHLPPWVLAAATPLCFVWLLVEVGVVEEFFFRALLQERLASYLRSPWGGLVVAALLFGLMHAPGLYLRPAATQEAMGSHPSLFFAVGYSIVLPSLGGLFLGVLWMRTRNFAVVAIVHAAADLLPNLVPWIKAFHFSR